MMFLSEMSFKGGEPIRVQFPGRSSGLGGELRVLLRKMLPSVVLAWVFLLFVTSSLGRNRGREASKRH